MSNEPLRLLVLGAHPDDAEFHAGGLAKIYRELGGVVKMVSLTDGSAGHFQRPPAELGPIRRVEAAAAGRVIGAAYETWDIPDGQLMPTLEVRERVIREIRTFAPDLVLTHRTCDYHPDHRAVGQLVQDASYLVTVPNVLRDVPALRKDPARRLHGRYLQQAQPHGGRRGVGRDRPARHDRRHAGLPSLAGLRVVALRRRRAGRSARGRQPKARLAPRLVSQAHPPAGRLVSPRADRCLWARSAARKSRRSRSMKSANTRSHPRRRTAAAVVPCRPLPGARRGGYLTS